MNHWYDDGYIVAILFVLLIYLPIAWVFIFRPQWADRLFGPGFRLFFPRFQVTGPWGKVLGGIMLIGAVVALRDIADHLIFRR